MYITICLFHRKPDLQVSANIQKINITEFTFNKSYELLAFDFTKGKLMFEAFLRRY